MKSLIELLTKQNLTLASCESLTGGLFATMLTEIAGVGKVFKGGFVVYSNEAKTKLVKISQKTLQEKGAISAQCAKELAFNTQQLLGTDLAISFTGNAGPTTQENKPIGLVYVGLAIKGILISEEYYFYGSREEIRQQAIKAGIRLIKDKL
jgi:PncC family amidohydrolase